MSPAPPLTIADQPLSPPRRRRDLRASLLLGLACLLVYNANLRQIGSGDTLPARYLPFGIWRYGSVLLDPLVGAVSEGHAAPYWIAKGRAGHSLSLYPVVLPVLVAPLYLPAVGYLDLRGWTAERLQRVARMMEKVTASLLAAAAAALFYLLLRRRAPPADALLLAVAFALGTDTWMIGSQALWQHGLAELLLTAALLLLSAPCTPRRALAVGALCGLIAGNRPPDALLVAALGIYGIFWAGRRAAWIAAGAALPLALVVTYNLAAAGSLVGGYGLERPVDFFRSGFAAGAAGLLLSPARGLFVFSPFLLLVPAGFRRGLRDRGTRQLTLASGAAAVALVLLYAKTDWRAGYAWGPRWLTDLLPLLVWMLPPALAALKGGRRALFVAAVGVSIAVQAVGAFWYTGASETAIYAVRPGPGEMRAAWEPANAPFIAELRHPPAPIDPSFRSWRAQSRAIGSIDRVTAGGRAIDSRTAGAAVTAGTPITVEGWALVDGRSPHALEITLDGRPRAVTAAFFDRADVRGSLRETAPAGWRISLATGEVSPGRHVLAAAARIEGSAVALPVARRDLTVLAGGAAAPEVSAGGAHRGVDLFASAEEAAARIRAGQQPAGFWLTAYTSAPRFERPRAEMNTYLTAMMIDLLAPVASPAGLGDSVARARRHLGDQIEASGLVRYHGRPDGPTIPALGCAITPDADDTALAWRLAGDARPDLRAAALATLARYRTADGFYRTWLAPRAEYRCIDPGQDPDPADLGIQLHVLLFLAEADPPAAKALCGALRTSAGEERLWVYYREAPLVPIVRLVDLRRAGCPLRLPEARLRTPFADQEVWLAMGRHFDGLLGADHRALSADRSAERLALLERLAADDFALLRRTPPLLYHNDLSARAGRYYWSEDFGLALWLRLYLEDAKRQGLRPGARPGGHAARG